MSRPGTRNPRSGSRMRKESKTHISIHIYAHTYTDIYTYYLYT